MSTFIALKRPCGRCPRIAEEVIDLAEATRLLQQKEEGPAALTITVNGVDTVVFQHLCNICQEIVDKHIGQVGKRLQHRSSLREEREKPEE